MAETHCPYCGHKISEVKGTFESTKRNWLKNAGAMAMPGPPVARPTTPPGMPNYESNVVVPWSQAVRSGFLAAPIGGVLSYGLAALVSTASRDFEITGFGLFVWGISGATLTGFAVAWWRWEAKQAKYDSLLYRVEDWIGWDLNGDDVVGEPEQPTVIPVEITENGIPRELGELEGVDIVRIRAFANLLFPKGFFTKGKGFSERTAARAGISQQEFYQLRDGLVKRGWATWKHDEPRQGVRLTKERGEKIFKALASPTPVTISTPKQRAIAASSSKQHDNYERFEHIER